MLSEFIVLTQVEKGNIMDIYVGNLSYSVTSEDLIDLFKEFGNVDKASVVTDKQTGRSKGFGFVTMENEHEANTAINALNGGEIKGRGPVRINPAQNKPQQKFQRR
jgi:RNA recognition motif-containing protein